MSAYIRYLFKTVRKYFGEAVVVTQEVDDIISSPIVKESIINNADCKILLDQRKYLSKFDGIQRLLGLTDKERRRFSRSISRTTPNAAIKKYGSDSGGVQSAVYATETSVEEYLTYTTEESEKMQVMELAGKLGGDIGSRHPAAGPRTRNENQILTRPVVKQMFLDMRRHSAGAGRMLGAFHLLTIMNTTKSIRCAEHGIRRSTIRGW